jgi:hypothetical protein
MARRQQAYSGLSEASDDEGPLGFLDRSAESVVQQNPLAFGRPSFYEQEMEPVTNPVLEGIDPDVAAANPLVTAPRPIKYMPIEQQIYWNKMQADALGKQASLQATLNQNRAAALTHKHNLDQETQSTAIFDIFDQLDPNDPNYQDQKTKLLKPLAAGTLNPAVQNLLKMKDDVFNHKQGLEDEELKRTRTREGTLEVARINEAMKIANETGDENLVNEVSNTAKTDPIAALGKALAYRTQLTNENLATQLRAAGVTDPEIKHDYMTSEGLFKQKAAQARIEGEKVAREKFGTDESNAMRIVATLEKEKAEAEDPINPKGSWDPQRGELLKSYRNRLSIFAASPGRVAAGAPLGPAPQGATGVKTNMSHAPITPPVVPQTTLPEIPTNTAYGVGAAAQHMTTQQKEQTMSHAPKKYSGKILAHKYVPETGTYLEKREDGRWYPAAVNPPS